MGIGNKMGKVEVGEGILGDGRKNFTEKVILGEGTDRGI